MTALKPCPCGQIPDQIGVMDGHSVKHAFAYGTCCGEWYIEFRTDYKRADTPECMALAVAAWNGTPRKEESA